MKKMKSAFQDAADLRRRAEKIAKAGEAKAKAKASLPPEETRRTLHELHVHQIELEMQNDELRRVQAELETARARYFDLYDLAPIGYITLGEKGLIQEANLTAAMLLGVSKQLLVKQPFTHFILSADQDIYYHHHKLLFRSRSPQACDVRMQRKDGQPFWARLESTLRQAGNEEESDSHGGAFCRTVMSDISLLKEAEAKMRRSQELLNQTERMGRIGGWSYDAENTTETWTDQTYRIFEIDLAQEMPKGHGGLDLIAPAFRPQAELAIRRAIDAGVPYDQEWEIITARNRKRWVRAVAKTRMEKGRTLSVSGFFQDISELKQTEEKLKKSLLEKELLLKEVHHRVKNNLMTIVGLIQMQEEKADSELVRPLIKELQGRVRSIALVHEILHDSEQQASVGLQGYFESMCAHIRDQFGTERDIRCTIRAAGVEVSSDRAIVFGLILNELLTNAFKHAFPNSAPRAGTEHCGITVSADHDSVQLTISVQDNGVGFPAELDWLNSESLGLRLIRMLSQQFNGTIEVDRSAGTAFHLRFPNPPRET